MKKLISILIISILIAGCSMFAQDISEIKNDKNIDTKVIASGTVTQTVKIGSLSGYILEDKTGSISVASEDLPKEGDQKTVRGTLKRNLLMYYIETE